MGTVALKPLNVPASPDGYVYYDQIAFGGGSAPPRPSPGPTPPTGPGGPVDPGYSPPWAQLPVDPGYGIPEGGYPGNPPRPTHPIMLPGMPGWGLPPGGGGGGGGIPSPGPGKVVTIVPIPPQDPPVTVPAGLPPASVQMLVIWPGGAGVVWALPYPSTGPVEPPATTPPPTTA